MNYPNKKQYLIHIIILAVICLITYFPNISSYPFIDVDETKFVSIAKDMLNYNNWTSIKLNGENFFNLSPLFFWITNFSCVIFGKINMLSTRLPISIISLTAVIIMYIKIRNILTETYALIMSLIFCSCLGMLIFSRLATNDMISAVIPIMAILLAYGSILTKDEKRKWLYWAGIYILSAFSVLSSGLFCLFIIAFSIILMHIFSGNLKEIIKPKNIIPGIIIFSCIAFPWHILMVYKYKLAFIKEYIKIYNFIKYIGIKESISIIIYFILAFLPWSFSFLWILGSRAKNIFNSVITYFKDNSQERLNEKWEKLKRTEKFISLNTIVFFTALFITILYGSKYTFLVLFMLFPASCITGIYWYEYILKKRHGRSIFFSTIIPNILLIICSLAGLFGHNILNKWIYQDFSGLLIPLIAIFFIIPVISIFAVLLKGRIIPFTANLILMISLSFVLTPSVFNFITANGGENDLINFTQTAKKDNVRLSAFIPSKKYSIIYYYDKSINFIAHKDINELREYLENNPNDYVVVEIKDLWDIEDAKIRYMLIDSGIRYCMIQKMPNIEPTETAEDEEQEAEVIVY